MTCTLSGEAWKKGVSVGTLLHMVVLAACALTVMIWGCVLVQQWSPRAAARGGQWYLEAILILTGIVAPVTVFLYPRDGSFSGPFPTIASASGLLAVGLGVLACFAGLRRPRRSATILAASTLTYYGVIGVCAVSGTVPSLPLEYITTPLLILPFLIHGGYTTRWMARYVRLVLRLLLILSLVSAIALPHLAFNTEENRTFLGLERLQGVVAHPNNLAILAVVMLLLEIRLGSAWPWKVLAVSGLLAAQSTTALAAGILCVALLRTGLSTVVRGVLVLVGGAAALLVIVDPAGSLAVTDVLVPQDASTLNGRTVIWDAALQGFASSPFFGYGPSLLDERYRSLYLPFFDAAAQAHNQWVQTLGASGLLGLTALAGLVLVLGSTAVRQARTTAGLSTALLALLMIRMMVETPLRPTGTSVGTFLVIIVLGMLATSGRHRSRDGRRRSRDGRRRAPCRSPRSTPPLPPLDTRPPSASGKARAPALT